MSGTANDPVRWVAGDVKGSLMYEDTLISGRSSLGDRTLSLTFDDGPGMTESRLSEPGPRTVEIARYLYKAGIRATFFVVGRFALEFPRALQEIRELGHLIGNHTYDHTSLHNRAAGDQYLVSQIAHTDNIIQHYVDGSVTFFRPPYGQWHPEIAKTLNANDTTSAGHVGPIGWDIDGEDWKFWEQGRSPTECGAAYLREIYRWNRRGIVLMHDSTADSEGIRHANRTLELIQIIIPQLQRLKYDFVRLDEIPEIASLTG